MGFGIQLAHDGFRMPARRLPPVRPDIYVSLLRTGSIGRYETFVAQLQPQSVRDGV